VPLLHRSITATYIGLWDKCRFKTCPPAANWEPALGPPAARPKSAAASTVIFILYCALLIRKGTKYWGGTQTPRRAWRERTLRPPLKHHSRPGKSRGIDSYCPFNVSTKVKNTNKAQPRNAHILQPKMWLFISRSCPSPPRRASHIALTLPCKLGEGRNGPSPKGY
jgi:hypothetical protein